jgi:hypothetical protein
MKRRLFTASELILSKPGFLSNSPDWSSPKLVQFCLLSFSEIRKLSFDRICRSFWLALDAQKSQNQQFRLGAQCQQRRPFSFIHIDGQRALSRNKYGVGLAKLIDHQNLARQRRASLGQ